MPRPSKIVRCVDCKREFPRKELNRHFRCKNCRVKKFLAVVEGMYKKQGPEYEHWKQRMKEAVGRL